MKKRPLFHRRASLGSPRNRPGFALVVALAAIVLMTVLVLAFFSRAILNRKVAFSSANQTKAEMMARYALDIVAGQVRQEIVDYSNEANGVFNPIASTNMLPLQVGVAGADTNAGKYLIAKVAADGQPVNPGSSGFNLGSSVSVDVTSRNGRSEARWFTSGPKLGSATLPTWVYLSRGSGIATNLTASAGADPANPDYVIGRFTYTVYNTGGLLNANVAGYPTIASTNARTKSSLAYADLSVLGIDANVLAKWRNAGTATNAAIFNEWATGIPGGTNGAALSASALKAARSGHISATPGDNVFYSRRDLLRYLETSGATTNAAQSLTHSSLASDAPSWRPSNVTNSAIAYGDNADLPASVNRNLLNVRAKTGTFRHYSDDGTYEEYSLINGDPLVQHRFSLAKLAWLGHDGPNTAAFASTLSASERRDAIEACFGLKWNTAKLRWDYNHGSANDILTLEDVRNENREPDFFELLKATILEGSLGGHPGIIAADINSGNSADLAGPIGRHYEAYSGDADRHTLQIGANIIDQADTNNYPTAIYLQKFAQAGMSPSENDFNNSVFGLENLPMLARMGMIVHMVEEMDEAAPFPGHKAAWLQPELWNPNESSTAATAGTPASLRLVTFGKCQLWNVKEDPGQANLSTPVDFGTDYASPSVDGTICFKNLTNPSGNPPAFFDKPIILEGYTLNTNKDYDSPTCPSGPRNRWPAGATWMGSGKFLGVYLGEVDRDPRDAPLGEKQYEIVVLLEPSLSFVLEYYDGTNWRPYSTLNRLEDLYRAGGSARLGGPSWIASNGHIDPRTDRFSGSAGTKRTGQIEGWAPEDSVRAAENAAIGTGNTPGRSPIYAGWPRTAAGFTHNPVGSKQAYLFDAWTRNLPASDFRYADPDGVTRPGNGWRANEATGDGMMTYHATTTPLSAQRRRAVILNRPFRSVAELGYVFRDQPFKTLDFWSDKTADAGLLDVFSISDRSAGVSAAQVNLNMATPQTLQAIIGGAGKQALTNSVISSTEASAVAQAIANEISLNGSAASSSEYFSAVSAPMFNALTNGATDTAWLNKTYGEAPVRALANVANVRTWNLLIDVVAQPGKLRSGAAGLEDFIVEGECRYWLHLAIDRFTGEVLGRQLEPAYE